MADRYPPHILDGLVKKSLLQRFAAAEEVAQAFLFLLESDLANGRIFSLDGGIQL
jgi:NAD(P)-dependent dehydrogenase (short-subunit alcohol dehydrogenase family)